MLDLYVSVDPVATVVDLIHFLVNLVRVDHVGQGVDHSVVYSPRVVAKVWSEFCGEVCVESCGKFVGPLFQVRVC